MSLFQQVGQVGNIARQAVRGDTQFDSSIVTTANATSAITYSQAAISGGIILRTGTLAGATSDVLLDANTVIAAISVTDYARASAGSQFRLRIMNSGTTQTITVTGGSGITFSGPVTIATDTWREFLLQVVAGAAPYTASVATTNASPVITIAGNSGGLFENHYIGGNRIEPGMLVTGTGIPANTTILGISPDGVVTLSANATATGSSVTAQFFPTVRVTNLGSGTI